MSFFKVSRHGFWPRRDKSRLPSLIHIPKIEKNWLFPWISMFSWSYKMFGGPIEPSGGPHAARGPRVWGACSKVSILDIVLIRGRSFFRKPFFPKFVLPPPPTGGIRWWKNGLRGLFKQVRLGQVRKSIKSFKSEALGPPIHSLTCFGWKFERTVFERTTSSLLIEILHINSLNQDILTLNKFSIVFLQIFFGVPHLATFIYQFS